MLPRIKKAEPYNLHIEDSVISRNDVFLHSSGFEITEAGHKITKEDFNRMMLYGPDTIVFGLGFRKKAEVHDAVLDMAKKYGIEVYMMPTDEAVRKFLDLARSGKKVVAKLHITC